MGRPHARAIPWRFAMRLARRAGHRRGVVKSLRPRPGVGPLPLSSTDFFLGSRVFERLGAEAGHGRAGRGQPIYRGFRPIKCRATVSLRPCRANSGAIAGRVCDDRKGPDWPWIIFAFLGPHSGSYVPQGNNGNMGTSTIKQAESLAFEGCQPVPKPRCHFGNKGTEMADPDARKSARMWHPPAHASRGG